MTPSTNLVEGVKFGFDLMKNYTSVWYHWKCLNFYISSRLKASDKKKKRIV